MKDIKSINFHGNETHNDTFIHIYRSHTTYHLLLSSIENA